MRKRHITAVIAFTAALLASCGSGDAGSAEPATTSTEQAPTTSTTVPPCGAVTAELVTSALGEPATLLGTDSTGCGFSAGQWTVGLRADPYDPATQERAVTGPMLDGTSVPHSAYLNNDRSGFWKVDGALVVGDLLYTFNLRNNATGADTYPGFDGPDQRPITAGAAAALIDAIARSGS
jgi:hypothetical protein